MPQKETTLTFILGVGGREKRKGKILIGRNNIREIQAEMSIRQQIHETKYYKQNKPKPWYITVKISKIKDKETDKTMKNIQSHI